MKNKTPINIIKLIISIVLILILVWFGIWWTIYKYKDCRLVGHTKTYCILDMGS